MSVGRLVLGRPCGLVQALGLYTFEAILVNSPVDQPLGWCWSTKLGSTNPVSTHGAPPGRPAWVALTHSHSHSLTFAHFHSLTFAHSHAYSLTHSYAHSLTDSLSLPFTVSLTLTHSHSCSLTHSHSHSLGHTHSP